MAQTLTDTPPPPISVSALTDLIKARIENAFPRIDVEGEISGWKLYPSGHAYFTLKDGGAQISAVMFSSFLEAALERDSSLAGALKDGAKVKVRGSVTVYRMRGSYQISVRRIALAGVGELMKKFLELKARLESEGLFDASRKRPLPFLPRHIGIVTSESGAVIHDMRHVFERRFPGVEIRLYPAVVQGAEAARTIIAGIAYFNSNPWADILIVARGGGSFEDLFCFNDEGLVRAVASSRVPVISAVGHETDFTLCDFAADRRAGTPSIAAEMAVPMKSELVMRVKDLSIRLASSLRSRGEMSAQRLDHSRASLARALCIALERMQVRLSNAERALGLLSPYNVLERGYSLVTDMAGAVVKSTAAASPGTLLDVRFSDGSARVAVKETAGGNT